jgi:hypothetical protein
MLRADSPRPEDAPSEVEGRLRRRVGHLGIVLAVLVVGLTSLVVFAICACKTAR